MIPNRNERNAAVRAAFAVLRQLLQTRAQQARLAAAPWESSLSDPDRSTAMMASRFYNAGMGREGAYHTVMGDIDFILAGMRDDAGAVEDVRSLGDAASVVVLELAGRMQS